MNYPYQITSLAQYKQAYTAAENNPESFWADVASNFVWRKKWEKVLEWNFKDPSINWFIGGKMNITENCLDRHIEKLGNSPAIIWESNDPDEHHRILTYKELLFKVKQFSNVLKNNGVKKG
ncbi:MAG TPA: acetyl-coenzyme A synthetase N-terminal domain-containing protein, partial [Bacteroidia bacterium]|nr:acetyl-coenzyme A synthetase N-terminal domain-containing protein [Bacteroidia bacterium]